MEHPDARFHRVERGHGAFARAFTLPAPVEASAVSAEFRDGVLTIVVPKSLDPQRRVDVR
jgi:HSP20 family protein